MRSFLPHNSFTTSLPGPLISFATLLPGSGRFVYTFMHVGRSPALSSFGHNIASRAHSSSFAHDLPPLTRSLIIHSRLRYAHPLAHDSVATSLRSPARMIRSRARCARFSLIIRSRPRSRSARCYMVYCNVLLFFSSLCFFLFDVVSRGSIASCYHFIIDPLIRTIFHIHIVRSMCVFRMSG